MITRGNNSGYPFEVIIGATPKCEVFCFTCGQLRLWCREEDPQACGNCGSDLIQVGPVDGTELVKLRAKWQKTEKR